MKQLSNARSLFGTKYKCPEGSIGRMEGAPYAAQTVTISGRGLAWNIKPFTWKIKTDEMLQGAWVLVQCFHTTWASVGNLPVKVTLWEDFRMLENNALTRTIRPTPGPKKLSLVCSGQTDYISKQNGVQCTHHAQDSVERAVMSTLIDSLMFVPYIIRRSRNNQHCTLICTNSLFYILTPTCFGRLLPKHVGTNIENKGVVHISA
jgi:hypothetical protein